MDGNNIQNYLRSYIAENKDVYTREIIEQKLIDAGYTYEDINQAYIASGYDFFDEMSIGEPGKQRNVSASAKGFLIFFPGLGILFALSVLLLPPISMIVFLLIILAGLIMPRRVRATDPGLAKGYTYGFRAFLVVFVCLPFIAFVILFGICIASFSGI